MNTTEQAETVNKLAAEFSKVLHEWLTPEQMADVVRINSERNDDTCASHDFCDANMAMDEAFQKVMGREFVFNDDTLPETEALNEADTNLINEAWGIAKANGFAV